MSNKKENRDDIGFRIDLTNHTEIEVKIRFLQTNRWGAVIKIGNPEAHYYYTSVGGETFNEMMEALTKQICSYKVDFGGNSR